LSLVLRSNRVLDPDERHGAGSAKSRCVALKCSHRSVRNRLGRGAIGSLSFLFALVGLVLPTSTTSAQEAPADASGSGVEDRIETLNWMKSLTGEPITSLSDAELVASIQRSITMDKEFVEELRAEIEAEENPYTRAESDFEEIDARLQELRTALEEAETEEERAQLSASIESLEPLWELARERFNLAIERRQLVSQLIPLLASRISDGERLMESSLGGLQPVEPEPTEAESPPEEAKAAEAEEPEAEGEAETKEESKPAVPMIPGMPATPTAPAEDTEEATVPPEEYEPPSEEELAAENEVQRWERLLEEIRVAIEQIDGRLKSIDQIIELERQLQANRRAMLDNAEASRSLLGDRVQEMLAGDAPEDRIERYRQELQESRQIAQEMRAKSRAEADRLAQLSEHRGYLLEALATRKQDLELAKEKLSQARRRFAIMRNPFHPRNMFRWFINHGPNIIAILIGMALIYLAVQLLATRAVRTLATRGMRGSQDERESRAKTLVSSFRQAATLTILIGGVLMILEEAGIPVGPLLGGAAVFGLAIAFGAQNLIADFFQGFVILIENQYKLNDVIQIGDYCGVVEQITLRTTVLRSLDGTLHFIPNGQIHGVSNMTHGWSRALFEIGVAYKEDVDHVIAVLLEVAKALRNEPRFKRLILEDATMLGVDDFGDSAILIKFFIKTIPLQQWTVRRELLRRIKKRFDAEGIEIPFPHRTVYHRAETNGSTPPAIGEAFAASHENAQKSG